ncbi:precorrin-3B C(17)-methyltransferase [Pseudonocardia hydrocarbonoxydans]|uniref:Precorrin-3B C(17)-methyltransferase n=1 Tax=Pseudonocardia hydrocarbonoxydans TaxID=76726 RepID=A0A4Y3WS66_9PSEU|nr:precorrin-3B C(17)-methyltransferase [Pseudonocardia hydrocarbonoxydans]GEC21644.1 precorrin-3B C(17)-methyltransferase [Pseudonocardia hydrocarbonoxydans]
MIALFAVTDAGRRAAAELAPALGAQLRTLDELPALWPELDGAVFLLAAGATVRLVAPLLADKHTDPGVVCVDEARRFAVALCGGHEGGANALAVRVAAVLGAEPVVTTASDAAGSTGLDELAAVLDAEIDGDAAAAGTALLDGAALVENPLGFPLPPLPPLTGEPRHTITISDRAAPGAAPAWTVLVPRTLVVGIGSARGVPAAAVAETLRRVETELGFDLRAVRAVASVDLKADEAGILAAIAPHELHTYPADVLAAVEVPNPSEVVRAEVGTASVAEAAALHHAGPGAELVVEKIKGDNVTVAVARVRPRGRLAIVGLGPGAADLRVPRADAELRRASIVVGLDQYVDQVRHLLRPGTELRISGLGEEEQRAADAVALAAKGHAVALIGSGDAGIYAMASPALEGAGADIDVVGVPGVTAALSSSALLGAPLGHDHVLISLSDLHTPWPVIEQRVAAAAAADLVTVFYNPRSRDRHWQLGAALDAFRAHRPPTTPVGAVRQSGRAGQRVWTAPLAEFDPAEVDMLTTVVVGSSTTRMVAGRMVTPRGYRWS